MDPKTTETIDTDATTKPEVGPHGLGAEFTDTVDAVFSDEKEVDSKTKLYAALVGIGVLLLFILLTIGLYTLGDDDQSALERLRDIAVIYIVMISLILSILLAATTAALIYLVIQIKDQVIPLLEEINTTMTRVRGTTEFMSEQAVKPVINVSSKVAQWRAMVRVATGKDPR